MVPEPEAVERVSRLLRGRLSELGETQSWLAVEVARLIGSDRPPAQATVSAWLANPGSLAAPALFVLERALQVTPGSFSRHLGYVPAEFDPATAMAPMIEQQSQLDEAERRALRSVFEGFMARHGLSVDGTPLPSAPTKASARRGAGRAR